MREMMKRIDKMVRSTERIGWAVLCAVFFIAPWFAIEPPMSGEVGQGYVAFDALVTGMLCAAALAQVVRIVQAPEGEHMLVRAGAWVLLLTLCMMSGRMLWILATVGDIRITLTMGVALLCLAGSVLLHAAGRVIYGHPG